MQFTDFRLSFTDLLFYKLILLHIFEPSFKLWEDLLWYKKHLIKD